MEQLRKAASRERHYVREKIGKVLKHQLLVIRVRSATRGQLPLLSSALSETRRDHESFGRDVRMRAAPFGSSSRR